MGVSLIKAFTFYAGPLDAGPLKMESWHMPIDLSIEQCTLAISKKRQLSKVLVMSRQTCSTASRTPSTPSQSRKLRSWSVETIVICVKVKLVQNILEDIHKRRRSQRDCPVRTFADKRGVWGGV